MLRRQNPTDSSISDTRGKAYFLSRPRRFGKSLLVDTLAEAFSGGQELFEGLWLEERWDWHKTHPVVKVDLGEGILSNQKELHDKIKIQLKRVEKKHQISVELPGLSNYFSELLFQLHETTGERAVVLVDEYDKPILDHLGRPEVALEMGESLRDFYSVLKSQDAHLRFVMLTGVSKFSKVSLFSGLNHLEDITLDPAFATVCGYTQSELEAQFSEHLDGVDLDQVRHWYNGYRFLGEPVYNPFDVLLYLRNRIFRNYWFETGTPTFLIEMIRKQAYSMPQIHEVRVTEDILGVFDVEHIALEALLFQTGYLTILESAFEAVEYVHTLGYPNHEVRSSLPRAFLHALIPAPSNRTSLSDTIWKALKENQPELLEHAFRTFFASIPNDWYRKNKLAEYEGYYASLVYCAFASLGVEVIPEDATSHGRIDLTVRWQSVVFILEFKTLGPETPTGSALAQIREQGYAEKYQAPGASVSLIGMEFDKEARNLSGFELEMPPPL